jgi:hypothetical protein
VKLSKQKAIYMALLGLGLVALIADRLFFAPSSAVASESPAEPAPAPAREAGPHADPADHPATVKPLSERLASSPAGAWDEKALRDGFNPPGSFLSEVLMGPPALEPEAEPSSENTLQAHKLSSVLIMNGKPCAIIDHKPYCVGDTLDDGLTIVAIGDVIDQGRAKVTGVELRGPRGTVKLPLRSTP